MSDDDTTLPPPIKSEKEPPAEEGLETPSDVGLKAEKEDPLPPSAIQAESSSEEISGEVIANDKNDEAATRDAQLSMIEGQLTEVSERVAIFPRTLRNIGQKIDAVASSVSEPRYRDVLSNLLSIYDLVGQLSKSAQTMSDGSESEAKHFKNYETVRTQLFQILTSNGFSEIESATSFDPELHCAVESVPVDDPENDNQILELVRPGFKNEHKVLRYADVRVGKYSKTTEGAAPPVE